MHWIYLASLNPYDVTEQMDFTWSNLVLDWTNGNTSLVTLFYLSFFISFESVKLSAQFLFNGDLDVFARSASRYGDLRLIHLPQLTLKYF